MIDKTLAQQASFKSMTCVQAKDRRAWLQLFSDDAVVEDPVGLSPLDPSGNGHRGKAAIAAFWDSLIAEGDLKLDLRISHPCGYECANVVALQKTFAGGMQIDNEMVAVYRVNDAGKIVSLKAYWDFDRLSNSLIET